MIRSLFAFTCLTTLVVWEHATAQDVCKEASCDYDHFPPIGGGARRLHSSDEPCKAASWDFDKFPEMDAEPLLAEGRGRVLTAADQRQPNLRTTKHRRSVYSNYMYAYVT